MFSVTNQIDHYREDVHKTPLKQEGNYLSEDIANHRAQLTKGTKGRNGKVSQRLNKRLYRRSRGFVPDSSISSGRHHGDVEADTVSCKVRTLLVNDM